MQEVFWRAYFKGWLEHRPSVWRDYRADLAAELADLERCHAMAERYEAAMLGETGIECFDSWACELVTTGYLHNHARMWFASIWVYTLGLPWQLGADFFLRHLIDGDAASNTLSWRWVCGLHTKGKTYLARPSNIKTYTNNRFDPRGQLAESAPALQEARSHPVRELPDDSCEATFKRAGLLITEEDCQAETALATQTPVALIGMLATKQRSPLPVGDLARDFARGAVGDAVARACAHFQIGGELVESDDWGSHLLDWAETHGLDAVITPYTPVGPVAEVLAVAALRLEQQGIRVLQYRRPYDSVAWMHARSGFFKLNESIPDILAALGILMSDDAERRERGSAMGRDSKRAGQRKHGLGREVAGSRLMRAETNAYRA